MTKTPEEMVRNLAESIKKSRDSRKIIATIKQPEGRLKDRVKRPRS